MIYLKRKQTVGVTLFPLRCLIASLYDYLDIDSSGYVRNVLSMSSFCPVIKAWLNTCQRNSVVIKNK